MTNRLVYRMNDSKKEELSDSSEDEFNVEALEEAVDKQMFKNLHSFNNTKESKNNEQNSRTDNISKSNVEDEFQNNELTQSCKTFIAKKLNERLEKDIILKSSEKSIINNADFKRNKGIRLFNSSTAILEKDNSNKIKEFMKRKHLTNSYDQKEHKLKCKQIAINTDEVLSQHETRYWTNRKPPKEYSYRKLVNGKLLEIK